MRKEPKPLYGILGYLLYVGIIFALTAAFGPDYDEIADSTENLLTGVILPVGAACVGIIAFTSWLGWWGPALRDRKRAPMWTFLAPLMMLAVIAGNLMATDFGAFDTTYLLVITGGMLLVGLGEELTTRGVLLVGLRGRTNELLAWLLSTVLFGVMHSLNFFFGQDLVPTLQQVGLTMIVGTGLYIVRRSTGSLVAAMLVHALWDFSLFVMSESGGEPVALSMFANLGLYVAIPLCLIWAIKGTKERVEAAPVAA